MQSVLLESHQVKLHCRVAVTVCDSISTKQYLIASCPGRVR